MEISQYIKKFIKEELQVNNDIIDTTSLFNEKLIDSLGLVSLVSFIEEKFDIKIKSEEINEENFDSIESISNYIKKNLNK